MRDLYLLSRRLYHGVGGCGRRSNRQNRSRTLAKGFEWTIDELIVPPISLAGPTPSSSRAGADPSIGPAPAVGVP